MKIQHHRVHRAAAAVAVVTLVAGCSGGALPRSSLPAAPASAKPGPALAGAWVGEVEVPGQALALEMLLASDGTGTLDIPAQAAAGLALSRVALRGDTVTFELAQVGASFRGVLAGDAIHGTMTQGGQSFAFSLARRAPTAPEAYTPPSPPTAPLAEGRGAALLGAWSGTFEHAGGETALAAELSSVDGIVVGSAVLGGDCSRTQPIVNLSFDPPYVHFEVTPAKLPPAYFDGELADAAITGTLHQGGAARPFSLRRVESVAAEIPYRELEVGFGSSGEVMLSGTLTIPADDRAAPAVVMVTGSGPQDRDECVFGVRPFRQLADHLARHGIASLRYDDRGTAGSSGDFAAATAVELADDAEAAVEFLAQRPEIDASRIGVLGHSEGGVIAPLVATRTTTVAFIVLWAGPGLPLPDVDLQQTADLLRAEGAPVQEVARAVALERQVLTALRAATTEPEFRRLLRAGVEQTLTADELRALGDLDAWIERKTTESYRPWLRWYLDFDPAAVLAAVRCPVLAVNGSMDMQVAAGANLAAIRAALRAGGNRDFQITELAGLNHLFQPSKTGAASEYATNPPTLDPAVLEVTTRWIRRHTGR